MANDRLDIVIFGATGYTGKHVVKSVTHMRKEQKMKFGVAGRRQEALEAVVKEFASDIENVPILVADVKDEESLKKMTEQARVLINCCGPYRLYGEPVVKACIATRTHYVDVTAEEQFMMEMQLKYSEAAKEAGIYVVSACGFDCIPSDLGILFTQEKFGGEVNDVEVYIKMLTITDNKGPYLNYATWESAILYFVSRTNELQELRNKLFPTKLPEFTPKLKSRGMVHQSDVSEGWSVPLQSCDRSLALRTQRFLYEKYKERPAQVQVYTTITSLFGLLMLFIFGIMLSLLAPIACGRKLLLKYPSLFTFGFITHENPDPELWKSMPFSVTIKARGWTEKLAEPTDKHINPPNKTVITKVSGVSAPYEAASIMAILSAITILNEAGKMPDNGGVLTPGAAFGKTSLVEQLNKHNIKFEMISSTVK
ncbi:PREDICTED: saccharopine dehydrogenase-like oxidoreductase isoform X1 [Vollenhovia emeryi]|nr:PREDICTED: saccharopine dehydrogenase-like oxidoreductase isoform X1 [Vollenhovia emeryi]XP_011862882.1 PREDICTED: saccharopine dehydrogenase-like oxidoreductase isoform X1 [Vollenhovia emeryi]XP_011862884.1 PREDICTED: saccharopine dehydrogenase-like oxidoreductase isoform X1 [Vollenhovia emeryi]XP_011862885.1 PREDICTED: saccharopine dehydrogenase-like oxidoreductase isoform X1 [Vollenhovia emeryi]XP_011862886.1 PREDICTED: saccharopine dehydrogenase-like oxidoreductase isoform X1 [Vollenhovi